MTVTGGVGPEFVMSLAFRINIAAAGKFRRLVSEELRSMILIVFSLTRDNHRP